MCGSAKKKPTPLVKGGVEYLNVSFWNIHGHKSKVLGNKFMDDEFVGTFRDDHIVGLAELHTDMGTDMYIGTLYLSPSRNEHSSSEGFVSLESFFQEIREFRAKGSVLIQGDFNAHTSTLPDFIESDKSDEDLGIKNEENFATKLRGQ